MSKIDSPRDIRIPRKKNTEHKSPNKPSCSPKNIQVPTSSPPHGSTQSLHDENGGGIEPPTDPLLDAIWRSTDKVHQLATRNRKTGQFHHKIVDDIGDIPDILEDLELGTEIYFACAEYLKPGFESQPAGYPPQLCEAPRPREQREVEGPGNGQMRLPLPSQMQPPQRHHDSGHCVKLMTCLCVVSTLRSVSSELRALWRLGAS